MGKTEGSASAEWTTEGSAESLAESTFGRSLISKLEDCVGHDGMVCCFSTLDFTVGHHLHFTDNARKTQNRGSVTWHILWSMIFPKELRGRAHTYMQCNAEPVVSEILFTPFMH